MCLNILELIEITNSILWSWRSDAPFGRKLKSLVLPWTPSVNDLWMRRGIFFHWAWIPGRGLLLFPWGKLSQKNVLLHSPLTRQFKRGLFIIWIDWAEFEKLSIPVWPVVLAKLAFFMILRNNKHYRWHGIGLLRF